ncbi:hypothetical protein DM01DRAFT_1333524 [Hesseltinella vesiculosa]|uniref:Uncharacterized protein n=1 Tax=Hesseltinella vesiculosa TaxID=101127 RepID=A0A1X2GRK0_9FUNG|nr:hypothetical protein DM01DRAFT_1333524 [Hesseltinella vesiculosa]
MPAVPRSYRRTLVLLCTLFAIGYFITCVSETQVEWTQPVVPDHNQDLEKYVYVRPSHGLDDNSQYQAIDMPSVDPTQALRKVNQKYCGNDTCRFLLPMMITEQESKAQFHFRQLAFLSGRLDRIIVLPNVHSSHLGACRHYAFDYYYDHGWLDNNKDSFKYITMRDFLAWTKERQALEQLPTAQEISIELPGVTSTIPVANCMDQRFNMEGRPRYRFRLEDPENESRRKGDHAAILAKVLQDRNNPQVPDGLDVIHLYYDRRFGYIKDPRAEVPIDYHPRWHALADNIAAQLSPFVAVHWRMEMLEPVSNLVPCAHSLVKKISTIDQNASATKNVFLLTDYPHLLQAPGARPESMSFKQSELTANHHDAIRYLYEHVNVTLTTVLPTDKIPTDQLPMSNWNLVPVHHPTAPTDRSVLGIVDKLVAIRSDWFLYGKAGQCGKVSSFTRRIQYDRNQAYQQQKYHIVSLMDTFNLHA